MRSILVTVDDTPSSVAARGLAVDLARQTGAKIRGVTAVEVSDLDRVELAPVGGVEYAYAILQHRKKLAAERRARIAELPASFRHAVAEAGLEAPCSMIEADIRNGLLREMEACDLVVTGRDTEFHLESVEGLTPLVEHLVARGSRPVVVTGAAAVGSGPVLVAYDGSAPAAKALQMAVLLGMFGSSGAHILSVCRDRADASAMATRAREFLKVHGVEADLDAQGSSGDPAGILLKRAEKVGARMLVMGAFGHRGFREILFGSCTRHLFTSAPLPLFIYH